ncbi:hypothetical protein [Streptomyces bungoensis]|uniref:hypothetical protein n=1 Tax=Streptomyces bungoensis TaxID=285568 RepID=UPI003444397C
MRKLQHVALVVAAAGGLTAIGTGASFADSPVAYNGAVPPPVSQPDAHAASLTSSQASVQSYGSPAPQRQASPQQPAEVSPQVNPQLNPQLSPQITPQAAPQQQSPGQAGPLNQANIFRPYQECSPQSVLNANLPVALLADSETHGISCTQANSQANAAASAH